VIIYEKVLANEAISKNKNLQAGGDKNSFTKIDKSIQIL
jgi:hypothetical protein